MSLLDALWLGLLQGLTEFIPVSSSGHLLLFDALRGSDASFEFETLTNVGTLLAAVIYFRKDIINLFHPNEVEVASKMTFVYAIVPVLLVGFVISLLNINIFQSLNLAIVMLIVVGAAMLIEPKTEVTQTDTPVKRKQGIVIGLMQVLALIPGTSRSGITILAGRSQGLSRELAARFSFMLSIPVVGAAVALTLLTVISEGQSIDAGAVIVANMASFTSAILGIHFLLKLLQKYSLAAFGLYRIAIGFVLLLLL